MPVPSPLPVALRTYSLAFALSLSPSLFSFVVELVAKRRLSSSSLSALRRIFKRELRHDGFAFAITLAVAGGNAIRYFWDEIQLLAQSYKATFRSSTCLQIQLTSSKLSDAQKTFISTAFSSAVGFTLLQTGRQRWRQQKYPQQPKQSLPQNTASLTLDLTMLLFVRAVDVVLQLTISRVQTLGKRNDTEPKERQRIRDRRSLVSRIDAFIFWACSARIMWCFFYEPQRLPRSYVKWIGALANVDGRLLQALNLLRDGKRWSYLQGSAEYLHLLTSYSQELGFPSEWGDPSQVPPYGGQSATSVWQALGVKSRPGVGGIPCEVVHGRLGRRFGLSSSCTANAFIRCVTAFIEAVALYLPVHFLPILFTRPRSLLGARRMLTTLKAALRSACFLSAFVASYWYAVCLTRTLVLARFFPWISHDFWDGPYGCLLAGSFACGNSIWIENGRRRGEMALYVLPRALRTCLSNSWLNGQHRVVSLFERLTFIVSLSTLLTAAIHHPDTLRGLSRWALAFIISGPNAGFWKRKRESPSVPPTPATPRQDDA